MPDQDTLEALAARAVVGDRPALDALCRRLQGPLFRLSVRMCDDPEQASDETQEILLRIVTRLAQFRGEARLLTWAYTIATRHLLRARSKRARLRSVETLADSLRGGLRVTADVVDAEPERELLVHETRLGCTNAMLACLSVEERMAIVLVEMLGAEPQLAAELCEVPGPTLRKRLSRARSKLRPVLEDLCGLSRPDAPCSCRRMAVAKARAGRPRSPLAKLPVVDDGAFRDAHEALAGLRRVGPIFAGERPVGPPRELWASLRERLPSLFG